MAPALVFLVVLQSTPAPSPAATLAEAVAVEAAQDPPDADDAPPATGPDEAGTVPTAPAGPGEAAADDEDDDEEKDEAEAEDDEDYDAGVRPVRDDLPSAAPPPDPHASTPEPRPAGDPTFPVYGIAFLVMCGAELGACFGVLPGFAAAAAGGLAINSTGDAVSGRRGTCRCLRRRWRRCGAGRRSVGARWRSHALCRAGRQPSSR
jgi:hypothetical protein